jgi:phosphoglycerol transferase MdoB-like AlkP superfamily enzyme
MGWAILSVLAFLIVVLNAVDGVLTYIGLKTSQMEELNPMLSMLQPESILFVKLLLSGLLWYVIYKKGLLRFGRKLRLLLWVVVVIYMCVIILHLFWFIPFFF